MFVRSLLFLTVLSACAATWAAAGPIEVRDDAALRAALKTAGPGTHIRLAPGRYQPAVWIANRHGTAEKPIVIAGADEKHLPRFEGGQEGWHFSACSYVTLRNVAVSGQTVNGINIDDGAKFDTPAHHITLENLHVSDIGPQGNLDAIKLSGLDDFVIRNCTIEGWGGQAVDMVGCHKGVIEDCTFRGKKGFSQDTGPQTKGGSSAVTIRRCLFDRAGQRAMQVGGSTGMKFFRPAGAKYEAKDITVEGCTFVGGAAAVSFVGVDGAVFRGNTIYRPEKWVLRILQETTAEGFPPCRNVKFEQNLVVFRRAELQTIANIGPRTAPETFSFSKNLWYCEDHPGASKPDLPAAETGGVYGVDPQLADPSRGNFTPRNAKAKEFGAAR